MQFLRKLLTIKLARFFSIICAIFELFWPSLFGQKVNNLNRNLNLIFRLTFWSNQSNLTTLLLSFIYVFLCLGFFAKLVAMSGFILHFLLAIFFLSNVQCVCFGHFFFCPSLSKLYNYFASFEANLDTFTSFSLNKNNFSSYVKWNDDSCI